MWMRKPRLANAEYRPDAGHEMGEAAPKISDEAVERAAHTFCTHKWQKGLKDMPCNPCIKIARTALLAAQGGKIDA